MFWKTFPIAASQQVNHKLSAIDGWALKEEQVCAWRRCKGSLLPIHARFAVMPVGHLSIGHWAEMMLQSPALWALEQGLCPIAAVAFGLWRQLMEMQHWTEALSPLILFGNTGAILYASHNEISSGFICHLQTFLTLTWEQREISQWLVRPTMSHCYCLFAEREGGEAVILKYTYYIARPPLINDVWNQFTT